MNWFDIAVFIAVPLFFVISGILLLEKKVDVKKEREESFEALLASLKKYLNSYAKDAATADNLRNCCSGQAGARIAVKAEIAAFLREKEIDAKDAEKYLDIRDAYTAFIYVYKYYEALHKQRTFKFLWETFFREMATETGEITKEMVFSVYRNTPQVKKVSIEVLTELLYQRAAGLGAIDFLNWEKDSVEEIQLGLSGRAKEHYDFSGQLDDNSRKEQETYSHDSLHIIIEGKLIKLSFISFKNEGEVIRILRNLIRNTVSGELSATNPMVVTDTVDSRRISVCRPPVTDTWVGLIRKFDTVNFTTLEQLVEDDRLRNLIRDIASSGKSIAVTGEMASGKTTLLRAILMEIGAKKSIRVIEAESFELNVREYLPHANSLTLRISKDQGEDEVIAFSKKTTGQVYAIGEVNSPAMAAVVISVSRIAGQVLFTAHYKQTEDMVSDFTGAQMMKEGYSDEAAARKEAEKALGVNIHLINANGRRSIEYINEVEDGRIKNLYRA